MRDTYGAKKEESMRLRFHTQTAGVSLTAQQPLNNIVRTTSEALAAVLGGTQSLHTNSYDEALALPTEEAVRVALRTQQILATETGVTNTADPLGGSWFVEKLTDEMEEAAYRYFARIDELGGMVEAIRRNFPQREIADASFIYQQELNERKRIVVGVNDFTQDDEEPTPILKIDPALEGKQVDAPAGDQGRPRRGRGRGGAGGAEAGRGRERQHDAADHRGGPGPGDRGRDDRGDARGLRHLHRDACLLRVLNRLARVSTATGEGDLLDPPGDDRLPRHDPPDRGREDRPAGRRDRPQERIPAGHSQAAGRAGHPRAALRRASTAAPGPAR